MMLSHKYFSGQDRFPKTTTHLMKALVPIGLEGMIFQNTHLRYVFLGVEQRLWLTAGRDHWIRRNTQLRWRRDVLHLGLDHLRR